MEGRLEDEYMLQHLRQYALVQNEIAEACFYSCVGGLVDRKLSSSEEVCLNNCATKLITATTRIMLKIAETNPMGIGAPQSMNQSQTAKL